VAESFQSELIPAEDAAQSEQSDSAQVEITESSDLKSSA
jgi:hypothetical protein